MPKLTIYRVSEYENRMRKIKILIDGEFKVKIGNGKTIEIELDSGRHTAQAKIDWCTSNILEFKIDSESNCKLELRSSNGSIFYRTFMDHKNYLQLNKITV